MEKIENGLIEENKDLSANTLENQNSLSVNSLFKTIGKQGLKAGKYFGLVLLTVALFNIICFVVSGFSNNVGSAYSVKLLIIFGVGLLFTVFALYSTYRYILIDTIGLAYVYLAPLLKKICTKIIDKVVSGGEKVLRGKSIDKMLNVGNLMIEVYGQKLPKYLQKALLFILERIPFSTFIFNMHDDLKANQKDEKTLSQILYNQLDGYIQNSFLSGNTMKWLWWYFPLNLIIQVVLLIWL